MRGPLRALLCARPDDRIRTDEGAVLARVARGLHLRAAARSRRLRFDAHQDALGPATDRSTRRRCIGAGSDPRRRLADADERVRFSAAGRGSRVVGLCFGHVGGGPIAHSRRRVRARMRAAMDFVPRPLPGRRLCSLRSRVPFLHARMLSRRRPRVARTPRGIVSSSLHGGAELAVVEATVGLPKAVDVAIRLVSGARSAE
jgi:hypothetical protein